MKVLPLLIRIGWFLKWVFSGEDVYGHIALTRKNLLDLDFDTGVTYEEGSNIWVISVDAYHRHPKKYVRLHIHVEHSDRLLLIKPVIDHVIRSAVKYRATQLRRRYWSNTAGLFFVGEEFSPPYQFTKVHIHCTKTKQPVPGCNYIYYRQI